jgi:hypothetical protein
LEAAVSAIIPASSLLLLLLWLALSRRRPTDEQRHIASRAHLDTYTPQSQDRLWDDWVGHHGGGL